MGRVPIGAAGLEAYRETFRRHRVLFLVPVVVALVFAAWSVVGAPKSYVSSASLWVDNAAPSGSSLDNVNPATVPPSQQEQTVLSELLSTETFVTAVADHSTLPAYLKAHPTEGSGPSALLSGLSGGGGASMSTRLESALGANVSSAVPGPQVLQLSFAGPTPAVAQSTLNALVGQLQSSTAQFSTDYGKSQATYYQSQYQASASAASAARAQATGYLSQHPHATTQNSPTYSALIAASTAANTQLTQASSALRQAQNATGSGGAIVRVIDPPSVPTAATSGKKAEAEGILGGLFGGVVISLLAVILMTKNNTRTARPEEETGEDELPSYADRLPARPDMLPAPAARQSAQPERLPAQTRKPPRAGDAPKRLTAVSGAEASSDRTLADTTSAIERLEALLGE